MNSNDDNESRDDNEHPTDDYEAFQLQSKHLGQTIGLEHLRKKSILSNWHLSEGIVYQKNLSSWFNTVTAFQLSALWMLFSSKIIVKSNT